MANKSKLNELVHKQNLSLPEYTTLPHDDGFICKLKLGEEIFGSQNAHSRKKAAEDDAAAVAVLHFTSNNNTFGKASQPTASTDCLINKQEQFISPPEQESVVSRSTTIDSKSKSENTKEVPLNMFYPSTSQRNAETKPSEELQDFCGSRGWTEPIYHLKVKSKASTCGVFVNKVLYSFNETYSSDEEAKQEAAKRVLKMLSSKPAEEVENKKQGITVIIPASKRSHPVSAKLVQSAEKTPAVSTPPASMAKHLAGTPVASSEEITSAISKLTLSTGTDVNGVDHRDTIIKQATTTSGTDAKSTDDSSTSLKQTGSDKNTLQHLCQKRGVIPEYTTEYPPEEVGYISKVTVDGKTFSSGVHSSKKVAEAAAAREAINYLSTNSSETATTNPTMPKLIGERTLS